MKKIGLGITCLVLLYFGWSIECWSQTESSLPPIDTQLLMMGLQHAESLIVSGKAEVHFKIFRGELKPDQQPDIHEFETFGFHQKKAAIHYQSGPIKGLRKLFNGKIELILRDAFISMNPQKTINPQDDPRNWGLQMRDVPLSQYLKEHGARILGSEMLMEMPCYLVESEYVDKPIQFWITPEGGFRCVQIQYESQYLGIGAPVLSLVTKRIHYQEYPANQETAWFPLKGVIEIGLLENRRPLSRVVMEVKDFQLNVDVSEMFQVEADPETLVRVYGLAKKIPFKEIGWKP